MKSEIACLLMISAVTLSGCSSDFDAATVAPKVGTPPSAMVEQPEIPFDPALPMFVVAVEPLQVSEWTHVGKTTTTVNIDLQAECKGGRGSCPPRVPGKQLEKGTIQATTIDESFYTGFAERSPQITAQLTSALSGIGNFRLLDLRGVQPAGDGRYIAAIRPGDVGPFVMRAMITEYQAVAEETKTKINLLAYSAGDNDVLGTVKLDVQIIDGRTGEIASAFPAEGTFSSKKKKRGSGLLPFYHTSHFAQSVMDYAMRAALNDAAVKTFSLIKSRVSKS